MIRYPRYVTPLPIPVSMIARPPVPNFARRPTGTVPPEEEWHCVTPVPVPPRDRSITLVVPRVRPHRSLAMAAIAFVAIAVAVVIALT